MKLRLIINHRCCWLTFILTILIGSQTPPLFSQTITPENEAAEARGIDSKTELSSNTAARFLAQATMGANSTDIRLLQQTGFNDWIQQQLVRQASLTEPYIEALQKHSLKNNQISPSHAAYHRVGSAGNYIGHRNFGTAWIRAVLNGNDQLRQRVAWALSLIHI